MAKPTLKEPGSVGGVEKLVEVLRGFAATAGKAKTSSKEFNQQLAQIAKMGLEKQKEAEKELNVLAELAAETGKSPEEVPCFTTSVSIVGKIHWPPELKVGPPPYVNPPLPSFGSADEESALPPSSDTGLASSPTESLESSGRKPEPPKRVPIGQIGRRIG